MLPVYVCSLTVGLSNAFDFTKPVSKPVVSDVGVNLFLNNPSWSYSPSAIVLNELGEEVA